MTVRELPISKTMAGVNMRLTAGGVRELHWHAAGEWAIMLYGSARITAVDADGKSFVADVKKDDLWYFPTGIPHSIQGLGPDGAEFLLVFDDGSFSEFATVLLSDTMAHTPREVLARNFGVAETAFAGLPPRELFIFQAETPGPLDADRRGSRRIAGGLAPGLRLSAHGFFPGQAPLAGGEVLHRRFPQFQGLRHDRRRPGHPPSRRRAGTALAPHRRRVAVFHQRPGPDDRDGGRGKKPDDGFSRRGTSAM